VKQVHTLVIGAGSGGITAAVTAAGFGKKVLLVDKGLPGGECTWSGCIPSKALIHQAHIHHTVRQVIPGHVPNTGEAMTHVHQVQQRVYSHETPEALNKLGIEFLQGKASFLSTHNVQVGDIEIEAKKIIIATGSRASIPPIQGINNVPFLTNESLFQLDTLPKKLLILGGGPIGVELAQALNRLGVHVTLIEMLDRIMPQEDVDFTKSLTQILLDEGVEIHLGMKAECIETTSSGIRIQGTRGETSIELEAENLLVAVGRTPNIDGLDLDKAGIQYTSKGILVKPTMQTSQAHIYAVGDLVGPWNFSHMANVQGIQAIQNSIFPWKRSVSGETPAWVTFTSPELARAGLTESEARSKYGNSIRVYTFDMNDLDRNRTGHIGQEKIKLILTKRGILLGATILADRAGEMIGEVQVLRALRVNLGRVGSIVHPYPTYSEVFQKIGKKVLVDNLLLNPLVKLVRR
jgi:pyruvate/2-oxoglutarate dehydrogenase complex dihydrolipoamide dehydrogenase (E3) component